MRSASRYRLRRACERHRAPRRYPPPGLQLLDGRFGRIRRPEVISEALDPLSQHLPDTLVVVPTPSAARHLAASYDVLTTGIPGESPATHATSFRVVTRDQIYDEFHARLGAPPRRLTAVEGTFLEPMEARNVAQIGWNLLEGAAVVTRASQLRAHGAAVGDDAFVFSPRPLALGT